MSILPTNPVSYCADSSPQKSLKYCFDEMTAIGF